MKRKNMKNRMGRFLTLLVMVAVICGFNLPGQALVSATSTSAAFASEADSTAAASSSIASRLSALEGVTGVSQLEGKYGYEQVYRIAFQQPVSYDDPGLGTFQQYADLYYSGDENVTIVDTNGYSMGTGSSARKFSQHYNAKNANVLCLEYRFFGNSVPEGLSEDSTDLWCYLTSENAAMDFHRIVQSLSRVLTGKRLWTGASKGGFTTNYQCYFQEKHGYHDADAFVAWVAPLCDGVADSRLSSSVYTDLGDAMYGAETAQKYRDMVLEAQLDLIKYRQQLQQRFYDEATAKGYRFRESYFTSDAETAAARLWDLSISELAIAEWQYYLGWSELSRVLALEGSDRIESLYNLVVYRVGYDDMAYNSGILPYYIQSAREMGNYSIDLSYLRAAVAKKQEADPSFPGLALPEELEGSFDSATLTEDQQASFTYSDDVRKALMNWARTTRANCIMIQGSADPWGRVGIPASCTSGNPHVHRYEGQSNHTVSLADLTAAEQSEIWALLDNWLAAEPASRFIAQGTSSARSTDTGETSQAITWTGVSSAGSYKVYRGQWGKSGSKCIATVAGDDRKVLSTSLSSGKVYYYYVTACSGDKGSGRQLAKTPTIYVATGASKYTNVKGIRITARTRTLTLTKGSSTGTTVTARAIKLFPSKLLLPAGKCAHLRYLSSDPAVARVSAKGKVTAKSKGSAYIYAIAPNGVSARVLISVK